MNLFPILMLAWRSVRGNPLRAAMTVLGVTWGVMAFMILMAYGAGMRRAMELGLSYFGDNVVVVMDGQTSLQAGGQKAGRAIRLERDDVTAIRDELPLVKRVSGEVVRWLKIEYDQKRSTACVRAVDAAYGHIRGMFMESGRFVESEESGQMARVAVLGHDVKERLFSSAPAVGKDIKINGVNYTVIGVLHKKIALSNYFTPDDNCVMIPFGTAGLFTNTRYLSALVWQPVSPAMEEQARKQLVGLLARRHNFDPADDKALVSWGYSMIKELIDGILNAVQVTMMLVGAITLVIGAIGVMNIMLLSVRSRTREIGTVMALGARRRAVTTQFLAETLLMTALGGVLGYILASMVAGFIGGIPFLGGAFNDTSGQGDIRLQITVSTCLLALSILGGVSLFFGFWPARQAARKPPVEALRHE